MSDEDLLRPALARMNLLSPGETFVAERLSGGVSCDVWKVTRPGKPVLVLKRALPRLRVAAEWLAPAGRWQAETGWLRWARGIDPTVAPEVLGEDEVSGLFALGFVENAPVWKFELAAGRVDGGFAALVGRKLAALHAASAGDAGLADRFANQAQFFALRLEPFLLYVAEKHADLATDLRAMAEEIAAARIGLMQGDISPKNILVGKDGPIFLDAETACYGDPVFDLSYCLNHLLLKCVWHREFAEPTLAAFRAVKDAYLQAATWEDPAETERRAARLLPMLSLARIDGKSPVDYLTDPRDRDFVRDAAKDFIYGEEESLEAIALVWGGRIANRA